VAWTLPVLLVDVPVPVMSGAGGGGVAGVVSAGDGTAPAVADADATGAEAAGVLVEDFNWVLDVVLVGKTDLQTGCGDEAKQAKSRTAARRSHRATVARRFVSSRDLKSLESTDSRNFLRRSRRSPHLY
jgi:hypothetical protein